MVRAIARVHPVHLVNTDLAPGGCQPSDQATQLGLRVRWKLAPTVCIHHHHLLLLLSIILYIGCRWEDARLVLMRDNFFSELVYFDKSQLSPLAAGRLAQYCNSPACSPDIVAQSSIAAARLCQWLHALNSYSQKHSELQPTMESLNNIELQRKQVIKFH